MSNQDAIPITQGRRPTIRVVDDIPNNDGNGGGGGGMLEARVARLESGVEHIMKDMVDVKDSVKVLMADTTDIKIRLEKMAGRQDLFESKLDAMDKKIDTKLDAMDKKIDTKLDAMDKKFDTKFEAMDMKFDSKFEAMDKKVDAKFDTTDKKFDGLDKKFATKEDLQAALHSQTKWLIVTMLTLVAGVIGFLKFVGV